MSPGKTAVGAGQPRGRRRGSAYANLARGVLLAAALCAAPFSASTPAQDVPPAGVPQGQGPLGGPADGGRRGRGPAGPGEPSDLLTHSTFAPCTGAIRPVADAPRTLRLATWNMRAARSAPIYDIAAEIFAMQADVVALQEVDVRVRRTGYVDQPAALSAALGFHYAFTASIKWDGGDYGLAVLSRWPLVDVKRYRVDNPDSRERRIVMEATVCAAGRPLRLFNHHADVRPQARAEQLAELARLVQPDLGRGVVVAGDFNDYPGAPGILTLLGAGLIDPLAGSDVPALASRVDYLLVDQRLAGALSAPELWATSKSDHPALVADLRW